MSTQISEQSIKSLFAAAETPLSDDLFTQSVLTEAEQLKRRLLIRRILIAVALFALSIPLEDYVLSLSQVLLVSLVELPDSLASQLLSPVNSVGGLLSVVVLSTKVMHKKLFHR